MLLGSHDPEQSPPLSLPTVMPLAVAIVPVIVPAPVMTGAGLALVKLGKVKAGSYLLQLAAGPT